LLQYHTFDLNLFLLLIIIMSSTGGLSLASLLDKFEEQMGEDIENFKKEVDRINNWEYKLRRNMVLLEDLTLKIHGLCEYQNNLERDIDSITSDQNDLDELLGQLEEDIKEKKGHFCDREGSGENENDEKRKEIYRKAGILAQHLHKMDTTLQDLVKQFDEGRKHTSQGQSDNGFSDIQKTLNDHGDCLAVLEDDSRDLSKILEKIHHQMV
jgi:uncharacterized phage infection (PIP) family protein YhgE